MVLITSHFTEAAIEPSMTPTAGHSKKLNHSDQSDYYVKPQYQFGYSVYDPYTMDIKGQWEHRDGDAVRGSYALLDADGSMRIVEYIADNHLGFRANVKSVPYSQMTTDSSSLVLPFGFSRTEKQSVTAGYRDDRIHKYPDYDQVGYQRESALSTEKGQPSFPTHQRTPSDNYQQIPVTSHYQNDYYRVENYHQAPANSHRQAPVVNNYHQVTPVTPINYHQTTVGHYQIPTKSTDYHRTRVNHRPTPTTPVVAYYHTNVNHHQTPVSHYRTSVKHHHAPPTVNNYHQKPVNNYYQTADYDYYQVPQRDHQNTPNENQYNQQKTRSDEQQSKYYREHKKTKYESKSKSYNQYPSPR